FKALTEGTIAEGAELRITRENGLVYCRDCDKDGDLEDFRLICPYCKGRNVTLKKGRDVYIQSMEIEDDD
ncbi:MAG: hydrogenase maturation nickel metallochaperone HypA, partial [Lachnospiraceae bacterium]|nr:hydrogenase maturation nickel metallochaperone HypA [Candidatus Equihabitans merdae]